ncbi:centromere protein Q isoform X2 [Clupea harengus]|uniref:Centromere protein Q n=1 Tax=Clupea harengus TaxID=7950 RepID=A0A6P8EF74_CLUHA|nr:centromere protein Q isoform X2 [Clupea harengus]
MYIKLHVASAIWLVWLTFLTWPTVDTNQVFAHVPYIVVWKDLPRSELWLCCCQLTRFIMKPARGSGRKSTQGPIGRGRSTKKNVHTTSEEAGHSSEGVKRQQVTKRKQPLSSVNARRIKGREKWKRLAQPVISAIDKMLSLAVLSVLSMKLKEKDETQKHLNILKERFLASCAQLTVPPRKQVDLGHVSRQYQVESLKAEEGEKRLKSLEENHRSVVSTLEEMEVTRDRLDEECRILRSRMEEQEENSQEVLQRREQTVLHLPPLPPRSDTEQPLQERLMKSVPNGAVMAKALQNMPEIQQMKTFMGLAHQHADRWLTALNSQSQST